MILEVTQTETTTKAIWNRKTWKGNACLTKLLDLHPEASRVFFLPGPVHHKVLYGNWTPVMLEESHFHKTHLNDHHVFHEFLKIIKPPGQTDRTTRYLILNNQGENQKLLLCLYMAICRGNLPQFLGQYDDEPQFTKDIEKLIAKPEAPASIFQHFYDKAKLKRDTPNESGSDEDDDAPDGDMAYEAMLLEIAKEVAAKWSGPWPPGVTTEKELIEVIKREMRAGRVHTEDENKKLIPIGHWTTNHCAPLPR